MLLLKSWQLLILSVVTSEQTPSANEDHVMLLKAAEKVVKWSLSWDYLSNYNFQSKERHVTLNFLRHSHVCPCSCISKCLLQVRDEGGRCLVGATESTEVLTIAVLKCWTSLLCFKTWKPVSHITVCVSVYVCLCVYARHQKHSWNISDQLVSSRVFFFFSFLYTHSYWTCYV